MFADPDDLDARLLSALWSDADSSGAPPDNDLDLLHHEDAYEPPDGVDLVTEVADLMSIYAAERLVRIADLLDDRLVAARIAGHASREIIERSVRLELAAAMRVTEYAAGQLLGLADAVTHRYRAVLSSLSRASITEGHAHHLVDVVDALEREHREIVLEQGLALAEVEPVGAFRRSLARLVDRVRYRSLEQRHGEAVARRRVIIEPAEDGMAWLSAYIPAVEANAVHGRLTAIAASIRGCDAEERTVDQLRADALCDLLVEGDAGSPDSPARGIRASVVVTVPALALMGGEHDPLPAGCDAPTMEGLGPIPLSVARRLCGDADGWMRVLTHPETGAVLSVGRTRYDPPASLRRLAKWRAERCMAPGCGMPASRCQIDHTIDWQHGGSTSLGNLAPLCQGHHTVKHHGRWKVRQVEGSGGALEWISPGGRRYVVQPERRVPVFRTVDAADAPAPF